MMDGARRGLGMELLLGLGGAGVESGRGRAGMRCACWCMGLEEIRGGEGMVMPGAVFEDLAGAGFSLRRQF